MSVIWESREEFPKDFPNDEEMQQADNRWHDIWIFLRGLKDKYQKRDVPQRIQPGADGGFDNHQLPAH